MDLLVVPSKMNPIGAKGNIFSSLFEKVPAKRAGNSEDIAGTVLYLVSKAGVSYLCDRISPRHQSGLANNTAVE